MTPTDVNNIVVVSDLHCGCQFGLCSPGGARMESGGYYKPNSMQLEVWRLWEKFWGEWVPDATRGQKYIVVVNGDAQDGRHHNSTHQWSQNLVDQTALAEAILAPVAGARKCAGIYIIKGTPVHDGESGCEAERLARALGAVPDAHGNYARYELWKNIGDELCHFSHHIGTTGSSAHEVSAVNAELTAMFTESGRWGHQVPMVIVRSHRHRSSEIRLPSQHGDATAFVTAGWQLKTPFSFKIFGGRVSTPQIGGSLIRLDRGVRYTRHYTIDIGRGKAE